MDTSLYMNKLCAVHIIQHLYSDIPHASIVRYHNAIVSIILASGKISVGLLREIKGDTTRSERLDGFYWTNPDAFQIIGDGEKCVFDISALPLEPEVEKEA